MSTRIAWRWEAHDEWATRLWLGVLFEVGVDELIYGVAHVGSKVADPI